MNSIAAPEAAPSTTTPATTATVATFPLAGSSYLGPAPGYEELREACPVARVATRGGVDAWLVTRYRDARAALADPALSRAAACHPHAPDVGGSMTTTPEMIISMDGGDHHRLRKLVMGSFTSKAIARLAPRVQEITDRLLDDVERLAGTAPVDLISTFTVPLPLNVIGELLGIPEEDRHAFQGWARDFATVDADDDGATAMRGLAKLHGYIVDLLARKRREPQDDVLSELIQARDGTDRLSEEELVAFGFTLIGAGFDTTACQLANTLVSLLGVHRPQWESIVANLDSPAAVDAAVEETLRHVNLFATDTTGFHRVAIEDTRIGDVAVKQGDVVITSLSSANRDPDIFANPAELDPSRADNPHLAFGYGIHRCLGSHLARLELQIAIASFARRFPDAELGVTPDELNWVAGEINHSLRELPITLS